MGVDQSIKEAAPSETAAKSSISEEALNKAYCISIMSSLDLDGTPNLKDFQTPEGKPLCTSSPIPGTGLHQMSISMPNGETQYWRQIAYTRTTTDFRAVAFQRCNQNGSLYLEDGGPHTYMIPLGSLHTPNDRKTVLKIVEGEDMSWRFKEGQNFANKVADYIEKNAEASKSNGNYGEHGFGYGQVTIGSQSMGVYGAVPIIHTIRDRLCIDTQNFIEMPVGANQALEQYSQFLAGPDASAKQVEDIKANIKHGTTDFRPNEWTVFSELQIGPSPDGNGTFGETRYSFAPKIYNGFFGNAQSSFLDSEFKNINVLSHQSSALANAIYADGAQAIEKREIFESAHKSLGWDLETSIENTIRFNKEVGSLVDTKNMFNAVAELIEKIIEFCLDPLNFDYDGFETAPRQETKFAQPIADLNSKLTI